MSMSVRGNRHPSGCRARVYNNIILYAAVASRVGAFCKTSGKCCANERRTELVRGRAFCKRPYCSETAVMRGALRR